MTRAGFRPTAGDGPATARPCPSGRHVIPEGRTRCAECRSERRRKDMPPEVAAHLNAISQAAIPKPLPIELTTEGACVSEDPSWWDPVDPDVEGRFEYDRVQMAKTICMACPVLALCRATALEYGPIPALGVWGGEYFSADRRARQRRRVRVATA